MYPSKLSFCIDILTFPSPRKAPSQSTRRSRPATTNAIHQPRTRHYFIPHMLRTCTCRWLSPRPVFPNWLAATASISAYSNPLSSMPGASTATSSPAADTFFSSASSLCIPVGYVLRLSSASVNWRNGCTDGFKLNRKLARRSGVHRADRRACRQAGISALNRGCIAVCIVR